MDKKVIKPHEILNEIITCLKEFDSILISDVINRHYDKETDLDKFIFGEYIHRFRSKFRAISKLLELYFDDRYIETDIGLILRSGLLDSITILYLLEYKIFQPDADVFDQRFTEFICDQIGSTFRFHYKQVQHRVLKEDDFRKFVDTIKKKHSYVFTNMDIDYSSPHKCLKYIDGLSFTRMYSVLLKSSNSGILNFIKNKGLVVLYEYYCKYEHFGILTPDLQRANYENEVFRIIESLEYMIFYLNLCINDFYSEDNQLINEVVLKNIEVKNKLKGLRTSFSIK